MPFIQMELQVRLRILDIMIVCFANLAPMMHIGCLVLMGFSTKEAVAHAQHRERIPAHALAGQLHIVVRRVIMAIHRRVCQRAHHAPQPDSVMQPALPVIILI